MQTVLHNLVPVPVFRRHSGGAICISCAWPRRPTVTLAARPVQARQTSQGYLEQQRQQCFGGMGFKAAFNHYMTTDKKVEEMRTNYMKSDKDTSSLGHKRIGLRS